MFEQEIAGIVRVILDSDSELNPYYNNIPEEFRTPAVFFPPAEVNISPYTLGSYCARYSWYVKFFADDKQKSQKYAFKAMEKILKKKKIITLLDQAGEQTNETIRLKDLQLSDLEEDAYQLTIEWELIRAYDQDAARKMQDFHVDFIPADGNQEEG